jgi:hypothetical protein
MPRSLVRSGDPEDPRYHERLHDRIVNEVRRFSSIHQRDIGAREHFTGFDRTSGHFRVGSNETVA